MKLTTKLLVLAAGAAGTLALAGTGWAYWSAHGSGTATATVGTWKTNTTTAVISSANPSLIGQQVTYTATVSASGAGTPTGKVAFFDGTDAIIGCGGSAGAALTGSNATCSQTYSATGTHPITATYLGDTDFNASAASAAISQVVNQGSTSTSLTISGSPATYGTENLVVFTSNVTAAFGTPTGAIDVKQGSTTLCSINLPGTTCSPTATVLNASPTAYSVTAIYSGTTAYAGSTSPARNLAVNKATPGITWPAPAAITYGTPLSSTQLNASTAAAGTFTYDPPAGTILPAGSTSLGVTFNPADTTNYESAIAGVSSITVNKAPLTITASSGSMTYGGTPPAITASYSGFVNSQNTAALSALPTCTTTATSTSNAGSAHTSNCSGAAATNYSFTYVPGTVAVNQAPQTITFTGPGTGTVGTSATLSATGGASGSPVTFTIDATSGAGVCNVSGTNGTTLNYTAVGPCVINANQAGNANYLAAPQVQRSSTVIPPAPTAVSVSIANGNGGTPGKPEAGDTISVVYSQAIQLSSVCSTWSSGTLSGISVRMERGNGQGHNDLTVTGCSGALNFGTLTTASSQWITTNNTATWGSSTLTWNSASKTLQITLGGSPGITLSAVTNATTYAYTPDTGITNTFGTAITSAPVTTANATQF
jgi:hypothetical protein